MHLHTLTVERTAQYGVLGDLAGPVDEVWMLCHGYGQRAERFLRHFRTVERPGRVLVAPEALSRFYLDHHTGAYERIGASWMTKAHRADEVRDYVAYLDRVFAAVCQAANVDPQQVALGGFGFSQGASTVVRWLDQSPLLAARSARAQRLVTWGNGLPLDLDVAAARTAWLDTTAYTLVLGTRDAFATPERRTALHDLLDRGGVRYTFVPFDGEHRLHAATLAQVLGP